MVLAAASLGTAGVVAAARPANAIQCPPGTVALGVLCIRTSSPAPTAPPQTTTTTAAPLLNLPPVTLPPLLAPPPAPAVTSAPDAARRLLDLANAERAKAGLGVLTSRDDVVAIAQAHSERMAQSGDIFHSDSFFGSTVRNLLNVVARGENVAYNSDIEAAHSRLMASAGHRANILDARFSVAGIGVVRAADGRYFITQDFIQPAGAPRSAAPRPAPLATAQKAATARPAAPKPVVASPTTAAPSPAPTAPPATVVEPVAETVPALSLAAAAPTPIAATGVSGPAADLGVPVPAAALVLLGCVSLGCWLVPRRRP